MARRVSVDVQARRRDGSTCEVAVTHNQIQTADGPLFVSAFRDIGWRKAAETELRIAAAAFESQEGVVVTDLDDVILRSNRAFSRITGYSAERGARRKMNFLKSDRHNDDFYRAMWQAVIQDGVWHGEIWNRNKSGEVHPHWLTISAVKDKRPGHPLCRHLHRHYRKSRGGGATAHCSGRLRVARMHDGNRCQ